MYECTVSLQARLCDLQLDEDDDPDLVRAERATLWIWLSAGVGLLWFFGWLLTL
jgi:hypothetical protein